MLVYTLIYYTSQILIHKLTHTCTLTHSRTHFTYAHVHSLPTLTHTHYTHIHMLYHRQFGYILHDHIAKSDKSDIDILMPTSWYMVHAYTHHTRTLRWPFFAGTNVWYFCRLAQKTQNFVPANIIYLQYRTLGFVNPVPFQCINRKI